MNEEIFVDFSHIIRTVLQELLPENSEESQDVGGLTQSTAMKVCLKDFEKINCDNMFDIEQSETRQLLEKVQSVLLGESITTLVTNWPPTISSKNSKIKYLLVFLARTLKKVSSPTTFLQWICGMLFPKYWTEKNSKSSSILRCVSLCQDGKNTYWAIQDSKDEFYYYLIHNNSDLELVKHMKIQSITISDTGIIVNHDQKENVKFRPINPKHIKLWNENKEKQINIIDFLTDKSQKYPDILLISLFHLLNALDTYLIRSILMSTKKESFSEISESLFHINLYNGSPQLLIETIVSLELENTKRADNLFSADSPCTQFLTKFVANFIKYFFDNSLSKIIKYIDNSGDLYLNKPDKCKKDVVQIKFTSALKYLISTVQDIPDEVKFIAHIIKMYTATKYNKSYIVTRAIASFFINCILKPTFTTPTLYDPTFSLQNPRTVSQMETLLEVAMELQLMEYHNTFFMFLDEHLKYHYQIHIEIFLYKLSEVKQIPRFAQTSKDKVMDSLNHVMNFISSNHDSISKNYFLLTESKKVTMTPIHYNFCSLLLHCFPWNSDTQRLKLKRDYLHNEHASLPQPISLPLSSNFASSYETYSLDDYKSEERKDLPPAPPLSPMLFREPEDEGNGYTEEGTPNTLDPGPSTPFKKKPSTSKKRPKLKTPLRNAGENDFIAVTGEVKKKKRMATVEEQDNLDYVPVRKLKSRKKKMTVKTVDK
ncbi:hypothetical protein TVAG_286560 [Trichomonas vaginalis G3]|uniref:Ras-GAP domain-containing protein n=1 Tax=Trichomonas vaginalis (strain ATCC PRA-98 / G3) TaxID=412133 RepID=A2EPH0_TRIV3|nr:GTPase activation domain, GAP family [Trichomonas vaginalis G3]EAY05478.1 hypothetical protein TVAG_286560 [Trichomonas vaginalis G3]KAI5503547.1 GTPase activation domain, GAP family [Trichomonas vaginalis G3]|eukprot:XP_001317701.1 hypothetical protein [Trichomonas vaginalis G3]